MSDRTDLIDEIRALTTDRDSWKARAERAEREQAETMRRWADEVRYVRCVSCGIAAPVCGCMAADLKARAEAAEADLGASMDRATWLDRQLQAADAKLRAVEDLLQRTYDFLNLPIEGLLSFHSEDLAVDDSRNLRHQIEIALAAKEPG